MSSGTGDDLKGVWGTSTSDIFTVGGSGRILHYDGSEWSEMSSGTANILYDVWGTSAFDVFAVGENGTILHYSEEPEEWLACFIATAAYGTSTAEEIDTLRAFRDEVLLQNSLGSRLVDLYYEVSPPVADFISEHEGLRTLVRELLVDPVAWLVQATEAIWED